MMSTDEAVVMGRRLERARVVSWLRETAKRLQAESKDPNAHTRLADEIEAGKHHGSNDQQEGLHWKETEDGPFTCGATDGARAEDFTRIGCQRCWDILLAADQQKGLDR